jgi:hypothetical protein
MEIEDKIIKALHRVVDSWGVVEIVGFFLLLPLSFFYVLLRIFQELEDEKEINHSDDEDVD